MDRSIYCYRSPIGLFIKFLTLLVPFSLGYIALRQALAMRPELAPVSIEGVTLIYRLICIGAILEMIRLFFNDLYVFSSNRIIHFRGRLSFRYFRAAIAYKDIRDTEIRQTVAGRLFNYGTVTFGTASKEAHEIEFLDLPNPRHFMQMVQSRMAHFKAKGGTSDDIDDEFAMGREQTA